MSRHSLFFALHGPNFDGHRFVGQAIRGGAEGVVIKKGRRITKRKGCWVFIVEDTQEALGNLMHFWRRQFDIPVIGVTGSNGKTSTKEFIAAVLASRFRVHKTEGNFNNLIGLPLTLAKLSKRHTAAVLEMGTSGPGEIARLCEIAEPSIGVVTNVARAHLEGLGSLAAVARAKSELITHLSSDGLAILNADDPRVLNFAKKSAAQVLTYGFSPRSHVRGSQYRDNGLKGSSFSVAVDSRRFSVKLKLPGRHNALNALAAIAVGHALDIPVRSMTAALSRVTLPQGRMQKIALRGGTLVFNDSYNANPDSVLRALDTVAKLSRSRRKLFILGDMLELGPYTQKAHREIGRAAAHAGAAEIVAVGRWGEDILAGAKGADSAVKVHLCQDADAAGTLLQSRLKRGDLVLLKGSRGIGLERVIPYVA